MANRTKCACGAAPTALRLSPSNHKPQCVGCAAVDRLELPQKAQHTQPMPTHLLPSPVANLHPQGALWRHQARALEQLHLGNNTVIATPTASGKTLIFLLHSLHLIASDPTAKVLALYPAKALVNDQLLRWQTGARSATLPDSVVQNITGDTPMRERPLILDKASVLLMTPDAVHAWLIRTSASPAQERFLRHLRLIITDEAHVYEDVLGTNTAFMFRRLATAVARAGNPSPVQHIAATATILNPERHLSDLTGLPFTKVDQSDNGAPRHPTTLYHLTPTTPPDNLESAAAKLLLSIIDHDPEAQVLLFHDSRQGAERIAARANRPDVIAPYRAGYLPAERREIEDRLRSNQLRALVATSALEIGIDMPDLNYGINLGLPPTRTQFHQRLGRVGRTRPAQFIILADPTLFQSHNESLADYYANSIEDARLHLDNHFIAYQHALCLNNEQKEYVQIDGPECPPVFQDAIDVAQAPEPPSPLAPIRNRSLHVPPQLAYSLRSSGEESLEIIPSVEGRDAKAIGTINSNTAITEAFPGAIYRHNHHTYRVAEWRRRQGKPYIRIVPQDEPPTTSTRPILRRVIVAHLKTATSSVRATRPWEGGYAHTSLEVWTSVEGYTTRTGRNTKETSYSEPSYPADPAKGRKSVFLPTSGFVLFIDAPWFTSGPRGPAPGKDEIAHVLSRDLSYQHSIALQNIGTATSNILVETHDNNAFLLENAIAIYDNIHGGLGLTNPIAQTLKATTARLASAPLQTSPALHQLKAWTQHADAFFQVPANPGPDGWWRTFAPGAEVQFTSREDGITYVGHTETDHWHDRPASTIKLDDGQRIKLPVSQLTEFHPSANWTLWQPSTGTYRQLTAT